MSQLQRAGTLLACSVVGFVCGTLYLYSAYGPQVAHKLHYTTTESSLIAYAGTIGTACAGLPASFIIDNRGFWIPMLIGGLGLSAGFIGLKDQYVKNYESVGISFSLLFLVGAGSLFINSAAIKCCAVTFPNNRGIATSFPIATYGLSAFIYSSIASLFFKADTARFLAFLGYSAGAVCLMTLPMVYIADKNSNHGQSSRIPIPTGGSRTPSIELQSLSTTPFPKQQHLAEELLHKKLKQKTEYTKFEVFKSIDFWLLLTTAGILAALGQMYIYSVGFMVKSLLHGSIEDVILREQQFQVSVMSIANCTGRLLSGIVGDSLSAYFKKSRGWIMLIPGGLLLLVQILGSLVSSHEYLWIVSMLNGLGYGFTWSSIPQILLDFFGVNAFSFGWGFINLGPIIPGYFFTHLFGSIYDLHSHQDEELKVKICDAELGCYAATFQIGAIFAVLSIGCVFYLNFRRSRKAASRKRRDSTALPISSS
ncbi:putative transporter MCH1 [Wickerhamomyces ciferrii]|uniref:Transporter MCH1 n=1 Tax=Wickerhamomyces ciferrii (strain ATCC 14091 / BCRC 22168 / CBS 111 / JCM 3599 / NBRC 0793 / NRRL Y-1031 F-60-10) TaxID=1206466 RepID=K0KK59_WICCF|nr:putative transporter MCH1 [Wickerhamomyces ciferrii]CCH41518.1 putative transporter MCH1 [Wickerhamomyces ciferrii]